ncbi:hypothetical protein [Candidatus Amarolinea dominans]|uniref:hypothetical protein n=1 Tax=Candidatus Amarolinea dominans TaxID=3140696 RepID=UPI0031356278|nr:hypothetical protein [Anaerolineae bacterium]
MKWQTIGDTLQNLICCILSTVGKNRWISQSAGTRDAVVEDKTVTETNFDVLNGIFGSGVGLGHRLVGPRKAAARAVAELLGTKHGIARLENPLRSQPVVQIAALGRLEHHSTGGTHQEFTGDTVNEFRSVRLNEFTV